MPASETALQRDIATLYIHHDGWLQSWLRRQLGCAHQAADLSHDTFEQLLRAKPQALPEMREPRAYLTTIAKRVLFNFWRRRDLEQAYLDALATCNDDTAPSAEERAAVLQALEQLDAALHHLPAKVRRVFLMNQLEDMSYGQIAAALGMPVISVRRAMAKAIAACCALG